MNRHEAVSYLREITINCQNLSPESVELVNSQTDDTLCAGFQIHIQTVLDHDTLLQIKRIAEKNCLAVKEEKGKVIIYQPKVAAAPL